MIKDYGSFVSWKAIYISNSLMDIYLPITTLLIAGVLFIGYKIYKTRKAN